jgi:hypothetical protein
MPSRSRKALSLRLAREDVLYWEDRKAFQVNITFYKKK